MSNTLSSLVDDIGGDAPLPIPYIPSWGNDVKGYEDAVKGVMQFFERADDPPRDALEARALTDRERVFCGADVKEGGRLWRLSKIEGFLEMPALQSLLARAYAAQFRNKPIDEILALLGKVDGDDRPVPLTAGDYRRAMLADWTERGDIASYFPAMEAAIARLEGAEDDEMSE